MLPKRRQYSTNIIDNLIRLFRFSDRVTDYNQRSGLEFIHKALQQRASLMDLYTVGPDFS